MRQKVKLSKKQARNFHLLKWYLNNGKAYKMNNNEVIENSINDIYDKREKIDWVKVDESYIAYYDSEETEVILDTEIFETNKYEEIKKAISKSYGKVFLKRTIVNYILVAKIRELQSNNDQKANAYVTSWLTFCCDQKVNPWDFNFIKYNLKFNSEDILNVLMDYLISKPKFTINKFNHKGNMAATGNVDCDKKAFPIYKVLGWQEIPDAPIRGDTINSFRTTFKKLLQQDYATRTNIFGDKATNTAEKLKSWVQNNSVEKELKQFSFYHNENLITNIKLFAVLTHSIGNFTVLPYGINTQRGTGQAKDYWDLSLKGMHQYLLEFDHGATSWQAFIEKYYLQPYVNYNFEPQELWDTHFHSAAIPQKPENFEQFYVNANLLIEERGKWITKLLCEKLALTDLDFYVANHLDQMKKIRFFNDIIKK